MYFITFYITSLYALTGKQHSKYQLSSIDILSHMGFWGSFLRLYQVASLVLIATYILLTFLPPSFSQFSPIAFLQPLLDDFKLVCKLSEIALRSIYSYKKKKSLLAANILNKIAYATKPHESF